MAGFFRDIADEDERIEAAAFAILETKQFNEFLDTGEGDPDPYAIEQHCASVSQSAAEMCAALEKPKYETMIYALSKWAQQARD